MSKRFTYRLATTLILLAALAVFYAMNTVVPFFSDDMACVFFNGSRIADAKGFFGSLWYDYQYINGRLIINALVLLAVLGGDGLFNILNTLLFGGAIVLFYRAIHVRQASSAPLFMMLTLMGFFSLSTGVDSLFYWAAGASNYVWALIPTLLFLLLMGHYAKEKKGPFLGLCLAGFLLSVYNEMYSFPVCAAFITYYLFHRDQIRQSTLALLTGFVVGSLLLALAPGNFGREAFYTVGLGYLSRVFKIAYSLRITYAGIIVGVICFFVDKNKVKDFCKENVLLLLLFAYSFVIPFLAATASRAMFATEVFALLLVLRLLNRFEIGQAVRIACPALLFLVFMAFQLAVLHDSVVKWGIYREVVAQYMRQEGNTVMIDDYQSRNRLVEYYTMNLDNIFTPCDKASQLAAYKYRLQGKSVGEEGADSMDYIKILPRQVYEAAMVHRDSFFVEKNRIEGIGFYRQEGLMYYVMRHDARVLDAIKGGRLYALYRLPFMNWRIKINYLAGDIGFERAAQAHATPHGRYILLNNKYKRYPLLWLESIGLNDKQPNSKISFSVH